MEKIKVFLRIKPSETEISFKQETGHTILQIDDGLIYSFDQVFDSQSQNQSISTHFTSAIAQFNQNFNTTILTYGQSNSGKTYTLLSKTGLVFQISNEIFKQHKQLNLQIIEIYNEQLIDLKTGAQVNIFEANNIIQLKNISNTEVTIDNFDKILNNILAKRITAHTSLNQVSSRSHLLIRLISPDNVVFTFGDLAGSEKQSKTNAVGQQLKEANNINSALLSLGKVVAALANQQKFVPFRDSKLTRILQNSLGGNAVCYIIGCINPDKQHKEESINSIKFCQRAMLIQNQLVQNKIEVPGGEIKLLKDEIQRLKNGFQEPVQKIDFSQQEDLLEQEYGDMFQNQHEIISQFSVQIEEVRRKLQLQHTIDLNTDRVKETKKFITLINKYKKRICLLESVVADLIQEADNKCVLVDNSIQTEVIADELSIDTISNRSSIRLSQLQVSQNSLNSTQVVDLGQATQMMNQGDLTQMKAQTYISIDKTKCLMISSLSGTKE